MTEDTVREALKDCFDPEVPCNIVDLGLVYRVGVEVDREAPGAGIPGVPVKHKVGIELTLTSKGCPAHTQIIAQIEGRLSAKVQMQAKRLWECSMPTAHLSIGVETANRVPSPMPSFMNFM